MKDDWWLIKLSFLFICIFLVFVGYMVWDMGQDLHFKIGASLIILAMIPFIIFIIKELFTDE